MPKSKSKRVLLTREDNSSLAQLLQDNKIEVLQTPLIGIDFNIDSDELKDVFSEMGRYDWITFSSVNGVKGFFKAFFEKFDDIRSLGISRLACVGEATARQLKKYYLRADILPTIATAGEMAKAMVEYESLENLKVLCVIGNLAGKEMFDILEKDKAILDAIEVYQTKALKIDEDSKVAKNFRSKGSDVIVFSSPSAVESFVKNVKSFQLGKNAQKPKIVTIGSRTSEAVKKVGMVVAKQAENPTPQAIYDAILDVL